MVLYAVYTEAFSSTAPQPLTQEEKYPEEKLTESVQADTPAHSNNAPATSLVDRMASSLHEALSEVEHAGGHNEIFASVRSQLMGNASVHSSADASMFASASGSSSGFHSVLEQLPSHSMPSREPQYPASSALEIDPIVSNMHASIPEADSPRLSDDDEPEIDPTTIENSLSKTLAHSQILPGPLIPPHSSSAHGSPLTDDDDDFDDPRGRVASPPPVRNGGHRHFMAVRLEIQDAHIMLHENPITPPSAVSTSSPNSPTPAAPVFLRPPQSFYIGVRRFQFFQVLEHDGLPRSFMNLQAADFDLREFPSVVSPPTNFNSFSIPILFKTMSGIIFSFFLTSSSIRFAHVVFLFFYPILQIAILNKKSGRCL